MFDAAGKPIVYLLAGLATVAALGGVPAPAPAREVAVTIDDLPVVSVVSQDAAWRERVTRDLLDALVRHRVPAVGFVNEGKLWADGRLDERRVALLQQWVDAGFELGNHTYSHVDLHRVPPAMFEREVLRGEDVTRRLLKRAGRAPRYFRHPLLHTGRSLAVRRRIDAFLAKQGYRVAPVTIDNYDFVYAAAYDRAVARGDVDETRKIASAYLEYMDAVVGYYEEQSAALLGRELRQTLLLHANALNAAMFDALASKLHARGYTFVTLDRALDDPAYQLEDEYTGPAGITWLHRWALTQGKRGAFFAGEPPVPDWIYTTAGLHR